ncbi:uncharacterized protein LOC117176214 [Belonocnema kinseyi]|uniref:uncharacterized protein LOC117176214 n=1 Tax=Belonocnema kinseyi TaxID=2817044 RepID=UPI00143D2132|nr:uncharacterized protein LOC117176214 [Belonocnema kinseyi]
MKYLISFGLLAVILAQTSSLSLGLSSLVSGAPVGLDGRVLDTPEVSAAKTEHAVAHLNERINLANEAVRSADVPINLLPVSGLGAVITTSGVVPLGLDVSELVKNGVPAALLNLEGRLLENSELRLTRAEQAISQLSEKLRLENDNARIKQEQKQELQ